MPDGCACAARRRSLSSSFRPSSRLRFLRRLSAAAAAAGGGFARARASAACLGGALGGAARRAASRRRASRLRPARLRRSLRRVTLRVNLIGDRRAPSSRIGSARRTMCGSTATPVRARELLGDVAVGDRTEEAASFADARFDGDGVALELRRRGRALRHRASPGGGLPSGRGSWRAGGCPWWWRRRCRGAGGSCGRSRSSLLSRRRPARCLQRLRKRRLSSWTSNIGMARPGTGGVGSPPGAIPGEP